MVDKIRFKINSINFDCITKTFRIVFFLIKAACFTQKLKQVVFVGMLYPNTTLCMSKTLHVHIRINC